MPCRPIRFLTGEDRSAEGGDQRVGAAPRAALGTHAASQPAGSFSVPPATRRDRHVSRCCRVVALGSRRVGLGGFQAPDHKDAEEGEEPQVLGEDGLGDGDRDREQEHHRAREDPQQDPALHHGWDEEEQVQQHKGPVDGLEAAEQPVVADPEQPNHGEVEGESGHPGGRIPAAAYPIAGWARRGPGGRRSAG
jgi:hypothetical protein